MSKSYGSFSGDGWEYRITSENTPRKWMNYIGGTVFGACIANDGTGYSVSNPPEGSKVTAQSGGRFIYLRDEKSAEIWSVTKEPTRVSFDEYVCRHGVGYTQFCSAYRGIRSQLMVFVPLNESLECWNLTLRNETDQCRTIQVFPYVEWDLSAYLLPWDAVQNYSHSYFRKEDNVVVCVLDDPFYPWIRHCGFFASNQKPAGFECSKSAFLGSEEDLKRPRAVCELKCTETPASTQACAVALQYRISLKPKEEKRLNFVVAYSRQGNPELSNRQKKYLVSEYADNIEWMLGVRPGYDGIVIDPKLPSTWKNASITRKIRGCIYQVNIRRADSCANKISVSVDGNPLKDPLVPYFKDNSKHSVNVIINS